MFPGTNFFVNKFSYPIALGPSGESHDEVEQRLAQELKELSDPSDDRNIMYSKIHQREVRVHAELSCSLMDQPERRGANSMMAGNSTYGARWGYSANFVAIKERIVPCRTCETKLLKKDVSWNQTPCSKCSQWELIRSDKFLSWKAPPNFPTDTTECDSNGLLLPKKLQYSHLWYAASKAHKSIVAGKWSKTQAESFLSYYCLDTKASSGIVSRAQNIRALENLSSRPDLSEDYEAMVARKAKYPDEFLAWVPPPLWKRGQELSSMVDVPMHLIFLGAVKGVVEFIHSWLKRHGNYANFARLAESRLKTCVKFNLTWFKALPYKGEKLGGWVSENFVSFVRVCKWFYLIVDDLAPDEIYQEPEGRQQDWKVGQNRGWLKARGLDTEGLAPELRKRVAGFMSQGDNCPPVLPPPPGTPDDLHLLVDALYDMVKSIMVFEVDDDAIVNADMHIKIFLSRLASCDKILNPDEKKPYWVSKYTYPCLLNLPDHMRQFGPLKNLWEGAVRGEGSIQGMKPIHGTMGVRIDWALQVMKKAHQNKSLQSIGASYREESDDEYDEDNEYDGDDEKPLNVRCSHWKYKNVDEIYHDYRNKKPICLVCDRDGTFGAILRTKKVVKFVCNKQTKSLYLRGMHFLRWEPVVDQHSKNPRGFIMLDDFVVHYSCILLPLAVNQGVTIYSGIREDYTTMDASGGFIA